MTGHTCVCRVCKRPIDPVRVGASRSVLWGHVEKRQPGDRHPARPPRGWTEAELREAYGR